MRCVPESNTRVLRLQNGDFDVIGTPPFNRVTTVEGMSGINVEVQPVHRLDYTQWRVAAAGKVV